MIELRHVGKVYQVGSARIPSLVDVSFRIDRGEFAVLHGPSGAGKTTLFRCLTGLTRPDEGAVIVHGRDVTRTKPQAARDRSRVRSGGRGDRALALAALQ